MNALTSLPGIVSWLLSLGAALFILRYLIGRRSNGPHCPRCAYDVSEAGDTLRCTECGYVARSPGAWSHRLRSRRLLWIAAGLLLASYAAAAAHRVVDRGIWGTVPTPVLVLTTVWDDPLDPAVIDTFAGPGKPATWREEMQHRYDEGELAGWKGRFWLWRTALVHTRNPADPAAEGMDYFPIERAVERWPKVPLVSHCGLERPSDREILRYRWFEEPGLRRRDAYEATANLVSSAVAPMDWSVNGGSPGRMEIIGGCLAVHHRAAERRQVGEVLNGLLREDPCATAYIGFDAGDLGRTRELARRLLTLRVEPTAEARTVRALMGEVARAAQCEVDTDSFLIAGDRSSQYTPITPPGPGTATEVLATGLSGIVGAADAGNPFETPWTIWRGRLAPCSHDGTMRSSYWAMLDSESFCRGTGIDPATAQGLIDVVTGVHPEVWINNGGDVSRVFEYGTQVAILAPPMLHAEIEAEFERLRATAKTNH